MKLPVTCYYCKKLLEEKHYQHARATGRYQATWSGGISCKKCFNLTPVETERFYRKGEALGKRRRKRVTIMTIPVQAKVKFKIVGKPKRV